MKTTVRSAKAIHVLIIVIVVALILIFMVKGGYDKAITLDEAVKNKWAQVDTVLVRRFDLIPNLVETVKGYAGHEKDLFENIAEAKTKYFQAKTPAAKAQAAGLVEGFLGRIMLLREQFPQLKANESFLKLQDQLEGSENRITVERQRYNEAVRALNTYKRSFIGRFFCSLAGVEQAEYFEAPEEKKEVPEVKF